MKRFFDMSLKVRLVSGFLLCALLTGFSGGTGMFSLRQIMARMSQATEAVFSTIDSQNSQINTLIPIRSVMTEITNAETVDELKAINESFQARKVSGSNGDSAFQSIFSRTGELFQYKQDQLSALNELTVMQQKNVEILNDISKLILLSVRDSEDQVYEVIEKNLYDIKKRFITVVEENRANKKSDLPLEMVFNRSGMNDMMDDMLVTSENAIFSMNAASRIQSSSHKQQAIVKAIFTIHDQDSLKTAEQDIDTIQQAINRDIKQLPKNDRTKNISELYQNFTGLCKEMIAKKSLEIDASNDLKTGTRTILSEMRKVEETLLAGGQRMKKEVAGTMDASAGLINRWQYAQFVLVVVSILIAVFIGIVVAGSITRPINGIIRMLQDIAKGEGDLTMRLDESKKDEMGHLAKWFNQFVSKIQGIIKDIATDSGTLNTSSLDLESLSAHISGDIGEFNSKSVQVVSRSSDMSEDIAAIDRAIADISKDIFAVTDASKEMIMTIQDIAGQTGKTSEMTGSAVGQAEQTSSKVDTLGNMMDSIGQIIDVIDDISNQINLLALNATIESARAGEAGKGFAVVAHEIKALANQTSEATARITEQIGSVQDTTKDTVGDIEAISNTIKQVDAVVQKISGAIEQQSASTNEISNSIAHVSEGISGIREKTEKNATVVREIATDMSEINQAAGGLAGGSKDIDTNARELARLSSRLKNHVDQFKI